MLAEYHDDEERELVKSNIRLVKCNLRLAEHCNDDEERELVESNARLADRLVGYSRFCGDTMDIVLLMTVFGASILGCVGHDMTFGVYGYVVGCL